MSDGPGLTEPERRAAFLMRLRAVGVRDLQVLRAMEAVPRATFFPALDPDLVLRDIALPLPDGQAAERPSSVALGLAALGVQPGERLLEIGTGSGYVTALAVRMGARVTTVERRGVLAEAARRRLEATGLAPDKLICADGLAMRPEPGSYACILVHLALEIVPPSLLDGMAAGGRLLHGSTVPPRRLVLLRRTPGGTVMSDAGTSLAPLAESGVLS